MNKVPNMISTKDLSYLSDIFEWNFNASKKAYQDGQNAQIESVKEALLETASMHKAHCQKILEILGGNYE